MDYAQNQLILQKLITASNSEEVEAVIKSEDFFKNVEWVAYGNNPNNAGQIDQMHEPENALIEKISNSIDSILMRKCQDEGIEPRDKDKAPRSMVDAINRYFGGKDKIREKRSEIAKELLRLTAEGKKERPTITIIDKGEGQTPENIKETILSLNKDIKEKIRFVYGTYNKGGASALGFAGPNNYVVNYLQLVLSRRAPTIKEAKRFDNDSHFGFTMVRKRFDNLSSKWTYEYFVDATSKTIFSFPSNSPVKIGNYEFSEGCVIKLYDYQLKIPGNIVFRGLNELIEKKMPDAPLPIYLSELRDYKGDKDYTIFGLREKLDRKKEIIHTDYPQKLPVDLGEIGKRDVHVFVLEHKSKCKENVESYLEEKERIFFIKDGLVLHTENISWIRNECDLPDLAPYLFLFIDISAIVPALAQMLHSGREKFKNNETTRLALQQLQLFLQMDVFKELDKLYGTFSAGDTSVEDSALKKQLIKDIENQPELRELFDFGEDLMVKDKDPGDEEEQEKRPYEGKYLPTKFELIGPEPKEIDEGSFCKVSFDTEAENNLFTRVQDRGEYDWSKSEKFYVTMQSFKEGRITFRIDPSEKASINVEEKIIFSLKVPSKNLLFNRELGFILRPKSSYVGKEYPTFFKYMRKKFILPMKSDRKLAIHTDAANDYLDKEGKLELENRRDVAFDNIKLKNGILSIRVKCLVKKEGKLKDVHIVISDPKNKFELNIPIEVIPPGTNPDLQLPELATVKKDEWQNDTPPWDENVIARIPTWKELKKIKINIESVPFESLKNLISGGDRDMAREILIRQIYIGSIWHFLEFKNLSVGQNDQERDIRDEIFERAIRATTKYVLQNIKKFIR